MNPPTSAMPRADRVRVTVSLSISLSIAWPLLNPWSCVPEQPATPRASSVSAYRYWYICIGIGIGISVLRARVAGDLPPGGRSRGLLCAMIERHDVAYMCVVIGWRPASPRLASTHHYKSSVWQHGVKKEKLVFRSQPLPMGQLYLHIRVGISVSAYRYWHICVGITVSVYRYWRIGIGISVLAYRCQHNGIDISVLVYRYRHIDIGISVSA